MSDALVQAHLDQLEGWLAEPGWIPDPTAMDAWNAGFLAAAREAERGPGWGDLVARAHALNGRVEAHVASLSQALTALRAELQAHGKADTAMKAYRPNLG